MIDDRPLNRDDLPFPLNRPLNGQDLLTFVNRVLQPLWSQSANAVRSDVGTVTAVKTASPKTVTVDLNPGTATCRHLASYTPAVGDTVLVIRNRAKSVCLGKLA